MESSTGGNRVKRWIFTILLFLLLGAVVNVAVAWGFALHRNSGDSACAAWRAGSFVTIAENSEACENEIASRMHLSWKPYVNEQFSDPFSDPSYRIVSTELMERRELGLHQLILVEEDELRKSGWISSNWGSNVFRVTMPSIIHSQNGWPFPCISGGQRTSREFHPPATVLGETTCYSAIVLTHKETRPGEYRPNQWLPLQPEWPWFLINTLFYAMLLWLFIPGPFVLRRLIRIRRGRCPRCGYDLRGQPPEAGAAGCPECGWNRAAPQAAQENAV